MSIRIENDDHNKRHIKFSTVYDLGPVPVEYAGNISDAPLIITFIALKGEVYNPVLYNSSTKEKIMIDTSKLADKKMLTGDKIVINTEKGNKSAVLIRGSSTTNVLNAITNDSTWLTIQTGTNLFNYDSRTSYADPPPADLIDTHLNLQVNLKADIYYEGV